MRWPNADETAKATKAINQPEFALSSLTVDQRSQFGPA